MLAGFRVLHISLHISFSLLICLLCRALESCRLPLCLASPLHSSRTASSTTVRLPDCLITAHTFIKSAKRDIYFLPKVGSMVVRPKSQLVPGTPLTCFCLHRHQLPGLRLAYHHWLWCHPHHPHHLPEVSAMAVCPSMCHCHKVISPYEH